MRTVDVRGGTPALRAQVRAALAAEVGTEPPARRRRTRSSGGSRRSRPCARFTFDRAFPHTLRVVVKPERPVLVAAPGQTEAYLVAASGRVHPPARRTRASRSLPRLWVTKDVHVDGRAARCRRRLRRRAAALAPLRGAALPGGVHVVRVGTHELTLVLGAGLELRLGDTGDLRLKLAIARRILRAAVAATGGVGLPRRQRPGASRARHSTLKSEVEVEG